VNVNYSGNGTPFRVRSAVDEVAEFLRLCIQSGLYVARECMPPERTLAAELGVARPTLRRALERLKADGYLEARQGAFAGTYVTDLIMPMRDWLKNMRAHPDEFEDIFQFDLLVETGAAAMSAERRTEGDLGEIKLAIDQLRVLVQLDSLGEQSLRPEFAPLRGADMRFHHAIAVASRSRRLADATFRTRGELFTAGLVALYTGEQLADVQVEHQAILDAIQAGDPKAALRAMEIHVGFGRTRYVGLLERELVSV
jgi:GntR family transcriptional regulator, transcriptional repressor for pyruvate dehydrogenase complex